MAVDTRRFTGFRPEAIDFLADLAQNNDRAWFQPRKDEYERLIKEPMEAFVEALAEAFERRRLPFQADPKQSIFRIYRDIRFSKDKSPYKTHVGASFPWLVDAGSELSPSHGEHHNGGYFHLEPGKGPAAGLDPKRRSGAASSMTRPASAERSRTRPSSRSSARSRPTRR